MPPVAPPMAPPPPPPWIAIIVILSLILFALIFLIILYKCTDMKRILAPRVKKAEDNIDQYFSVMSHQEVKKEEEAEDLTLNPVVQARMHIDTTHAEGQRSTSSRPARCAGSTSKSAATRSTPRRTRSRISTGS